MIQRKGLPTLTTRPVLNSLPPTKIPNNQDLKLPEEPVYGSVPSRGPNDQGPSSPTEEVHLRVLGPSKKLFKGPLMFFL